MNVIAFSLYGNDEKYWKGLLRNLEVAPNIYPGWVVFVYCTKNWAQLLKQSPYWISTICFTMRDHDPRGLFWRFIPSSFKSIERTIVRDTDSILNVREKAAVDEWIASEKPFHSMRDHVDHTVPIMGGMWGCVNGLLPNMEKEIDAWGEYQKGSDQNFLAQKIWPHIKGQCIAHSYSPETCLRYFGAHDCRPFPPHPPLIGTNHVGEIVS